MKLSQNGIIDKPSCFKPMGPWINLKKIQKVFRTRVCLRVAKFELL